MTLPFTIRVQDGVPVSDQIVQAVRRAIFTGELADGEAFPSVRALSQALRISPTTAHKVVSQLRGAGLLASRPGIGMVVTAANLPSRDERLVRLQPTCRQLLSEASELNLTARDAAEALRRVIAEAAAEPKPLN
ncbi:MAG: GntR family transcriptional regulator [Verrucomicrobiales bacterium]|nr:GntR family transcriptional regulator [Verrucomicrobiales bacterium]MCP5527813.1 GntR family transcriptional regulator [Verrucomicrobiales bacterium]